MIILATAAGIIAFAAFLAGVVEAIVEGLISPWVDRLVADGDLRQSVKWIAATVLGIVIAYGMDLDVIALAAQAFDVNPPAWSWVSFALTGFVIGRGAEYVHGLFEKVGVRA